MENKAKQEAERIYNEYYQMLTGSVDLLGIERHFLAKRLSIKCVWRK